MSRYDYERSDDPNYRQRTRNQQPNNRDSARSDYGDRAYGGMLDKRGLDGNRLADRREIDRSQYPDRYPKDRGFMERAGDEIRSWFGNEEAERRRQIDDTRDWRSRDYDDNRTLSEPELHRRLRDHSRTQRSDETRRRVAGALVKDIMTKDIATVYPDDRVERAARLMRECDCGAIPVISRTGRLLGMITDRDIAIRLVAYKEDVIESRVGDFMSHDVVTCEHDDDLDTCRSVMADHQLRRLPVVNDRGQIEGIVTQGDLARYAKSHAGNGARRLVGDLVATISEPATSR